MPFINWKPSQRVVTLLSATVFGASMSVLSAGEPPQGGSPNSAPPQQGSMPEVSEALNPKTASELAASEQGNGTTGKSGVRTAAASTTTTTATPRPTPSTNVTINLINRLVQRGALTQRDADELIKQAEEDARLAREQLAAAAKPTAKDQGSSTLLAGDSAPPPIETSASGAETVAPPSGPPNERATVDTSPDEDSVRVQYVPEIVKQQLRDEIRQEVMDQAREENWANPRTFPEWVSRITPFFDLRVRYYGTFYPSGSDNTGAFPNFNAINTGPPFDVTGTTFSPQLDVDRDRERVQLRARFGAEMDLDDYFTAGLRIATGTTNTPTSTDQTLGVANGGQGGNFSKYAIWLDRAFVKFELGGGPAADFQVNLGRFENPFFSPTELIWDVDLGWDGLAISGRYKVAEGVTPFAAIGGFPVFNTELNFSSNRPDKFPSEDKWLFGVQAGSSFRFSKDFSATIAGAYYHFDNIEGKLSSPFVPLTSSDQGNTDDSRPAFAQKGNTYFPIRDIIPTPDNNFGTTKQFQYFGLATPFRLVNVSGSLDYAHFDPFYLTLYGEFVENTAFDYNNINSKAINNRGPNRGPGVPGNFVGGNTAWIIGLRGGRPVLEKRWDWTVGVNYRYIESDAVVDAFNDSDFGGGGTNLKGYTVYGALALSPHIALALRWMSADQVSGPTFHTDIFQFDFNTSF